MTLNQGVLWLPHLRYFHSAIGSVYGMTTGLVFSDDHFNIGLWTHKHQLTIF